MIHHMFRALSRLLPHVHKTATSQLTPRAWLRAGKPAQHTADFVARQAAKGFQFPKKG